MQNSLATNTGGEVSVLFCVLLLALFAGDQLRGTNYRSSSMTRCFEK